MINIMPITRVIETIPNPRSINKLSYKPSPYKIYTFKYEKPQLSYARKNNFSKFVHIDFDHLKNNSELITSNNDIEKKEDETLVPKHIINITRQVISMSSFDDLPEYFAKNSHTIIKTKNTSEEHIKKVILEYLGYCQKNEIILCQAKKLYFCAENNVFVYNNFTASINDKKLKFCTVSNFNSSVNNFGETDCGIIILK